VQIFVLFLVNVLVAALVARPLMRGLRDQSNVRRVRPHLDQARALGVLSNAPYVCTGVQVGVTVAALAAAQAKMARLFGAYGGGLGAASLRRRDVGGGSYALPRADLAEIRARHYDRLRPQVNPDLGLFLEIAKP